MTGGVPYSLTVPKPPTRDSLTDEQFNAMMEKGYDQAKSGDGLSVDKAFAKISRNNKSGYESEVEDNGVE